MTLPTINGAGKTGRPITHAGYPAHKPEQKPSFPRQALRRSHEDGPPQWSVAHRKLLPTFPHRLFTFSSGITWVLRKPSSLVSEDAAPLCPEAETPASPKETGDRAPLSRDAEPGVLPQGPRPRPRA